jgi:hypothetical protein
MRALSPQGFSSGSTSKKTGVSVISLGASTRTAPTLPNPTVRSLRPTAAGTRTQTAAWRGRPGNQDSMELPNANEKQTAEEIAAGWSFYAERTTEPVRHKNVARPHCQGNE